MDTEKHRWPCKRLRYCVLDTLSSHASWEEKNNFQLAQKTM